MANVVEGLGIMVLLVLGCSVLVLILSIIGVFISRILIALEEKIDNRRWKNED